MSVDAPAHDDTRARILKAALHLFAEHGFAGTSTREISERLGFTKAALYYHFRTKDDLLAAIPLVWAIAFALIALERPADAVSARWVALSGLLAGVSAACKLSNGPLAVLLPLLWVFAAPATLGARVRRAALGCGMTLAGFALTLGYWGTLLWTYYGNPLYPFFENVFAPLRAMVGWHP